MALIDARGGGSEDVMAEINITPFTDVLLVLLIIFMILAALITPPGFQKELPNKSNNTTTAQEQKKNIEVDVNDKGVIFIDGKRSDADHVYADMAAVAQRRGRLHVSIIADAKAPYGLIIRILDAAKLANLEDIGFVTS
jgi:biopolymer transport protein ExbD